MLVAGLTWALQLLFLGCVGAAAATHSIHTFKSSLAAQGAVVVSCVATIWWGEQALLPRCVQRCNPRARTKVPECGKRRGMQTAPNLLLALPPPLLSCARRWLWGSRSAAPSTCTSWECLM